MDMTKFEDGGDSGFKAVAGELRRWVKQLIAPSDARILEAAALQPQQPDNGAMEGLSTSESESRYPVSCVIMFHWPLFTSHCKYTFSFVYCNISHKDSKYSR